jgi:twitching motility protein PilT
LSSNIEKLLDGLIGQKGERLVINTLEPIFIFKAGKKLVVFKKVLSDKEFDFIEAEYSRIFQDQAEFKYKGTLIATTREGNHREFFFSTARTAPEPVPIEAAPTQPPSPAPDSVPSSPPEKPTPLPHSGELPDVDHLLRLMLEKRASDLHLTSFCKPVMRIDGDMVTLEEYPEMPDEYLFQEMVRIAPERNIEEYTETNDTDFAYQIEGLARFRANIFRDTKGPGAVFRVIPSKILTVEDLNVPRAMVGLCDIPKGLILVTGPTGSGKSTTLAALIDHINSTQKKHIITIEDPVEFIHPNKLSLVNQREIHSHTQSFKRALRAALREDPDIILVGEMRDLETIAIAIEMAVTGHLVFGTLHTSTAIGTVDRIIDQFPADQQAQIKTMLSDALIGVVSQTLLKRKTGGRAAAYEVLVVTPAVSNLIREGKNFQIAALMQTGRGIGMQMINSHLAELVEKGIVEAAEAISKAIDKENLKTILKGKNLLND